MPTVRIRGRDAESNSKTFGGICPDAGFTLIELLVVAVILPVVVGAITLAFIEILTQRTTVSNRILDSSDAQTVSTNFQSDVHSALQVTTDSAIPQCGTGTSILGLRWNLDSKGDYQTTVSYTKVQQAGTWSLVRNYCVEGSTSPASHNEVAADIPAGQGVPIVAPATAGTAAAAGWTSTEAVTSVKLAITSPGSNYPYTLLADPAVRASNNPGSTLVPQNTTCGFANPGTGTYASTLCFVDFGGFSMAGHRTTYCGGSGQSEVDAGVVNTPFTLKFCVQATGTPVSAASIPTYPYTAYSDGTFSEAFLGNNGFYAGIPGQSALYQDTSGDTTVSVTKIEVLDAAGNPATGWSLVTGDAESTDNREGMIYTTCPNVANPGRDGNGELVWNARYAACISSPATPAPVFQLIPNSSTSPFGNACHAPDYPDSSAGWANFRLSGVPYTDILTGVTSGIDTDTVQCFATTSSDKTGTVMLAAPTPSNLTVFMHGDGREAVFIGMQLP